MLNIGMVNGLTEYEQGRFQKLLDVYNSHAPKNAEKDKYYEGKISLNEVNLGIALPEGLRDLQIGCAWGAKTVDVLAARSMFDGFVGVNGSEVETSVGFKNAGYAQLKGKMVPIPVIVNSINSGTSFMRKQPFVRKAASGASNQAIEAMQKRIEEEFEAIGKQYSAHMK